MKMFSFEFLSLFIAPDLLTLHLMTFAIWGLCLIVTILKVHASYISTPNNLELNMHIRLTLQNLRRKNENVFTKQYYIEHNNKLI